MVNSKGWNWEIVDDSIWLDPAEESYYYCRKWKNDGKRSVLDLGCGLGRHSLLFAQNGFKVTAVDISDYAVKQVRENSDRLGLNIRTLVSDMANLPFRENSFDCIFSYLTISHTDTEGFSKILSDIKRILKPDGEIYLTLCSKESQSFKEEKFPKIDENTIVKTEEGPENGVPHFFVDFEDVKRLFEPDFQLLRVRHILNCLHEKIIQNNHHYHICAKLIKPVLNLDFSDVIGKEVNGTIDRPLGSAHPRHKNLIYPVNYGYVNGIIAGDGAEQDVYYLGENEPVKSFSGKVIAVAHRFNDVEDKWIVAKDGVPFTKGEIEKATEFQEKYFDTEIIM